MKRHESAIRPAGPIATVTGAILIYASLCGIASAQPPTAVPPGAPGMSGSVGPTFAVVGEVEVTDVVSVDVTDVVDVKNVNEPGRRPYEAYIEYSSLGCNGVSCSNFNSLGSVVLFDGPEVPAGTRLVVKQLSGRLPNSDLVNISVALQEYQILSQQRVKFAFYGPFYQQGGLAGFTTDTFFTYGPGERPHFNLILPNSNNFIGYITLSGYLIDAD